MYYGNDLQENSDSGGNPDDSNSFYSDTLNQILLPVTLIFVYMIALMAADLIGVRYQFTRLMEKWEKTDKNQLIIQLEKQKIIKAFEEIKDKKKKYLGLDLLETGNYEFVIELSNNGNIKVLELEKLCVGEKKKVEVGLSEYGKRIKKSLSNKESKENEKEELYIEKKELYKEVLDKLNLMDSGRGWFPYKMDKTKRDAIDIENAKYLQNLIISYLNTIEKAIIEFQKKLIIELSKFFNSRLDVWEIWDPSSYKKFKEKVVPFTISKKEADRANARIFRDEVDKSITDRLKKDVSAHYYVLPATWEGIE